MTPDSPIKLVSELLDLPLCDVDGKWCGVVDDVEFIGQAGKPLQLKALLVGPGAYSGRMPRWAMLCVRKIGGDRVTRVPVDRIKSIRNVVHLECAAAELGLDKSENVARRWIPRKGAM